MSSKARTTETQSYAQMMGRMMNSYGKRVGNGDLQDLAGLASFVADAEAALRSAVRALRDDQGYSWADVASVLGCTRQAAQQRFGRPASDRTLTIDLPTFRTKCNAS